MHPQSGLNPSQKLLQCEEYTQRPEMLMFEGIPAERYPLAIATLREVIDLESVRVMQCSGSLSIEKLAWALLVQGRNMIGLPSDSVWVSYLESVSPMNKVWRPEKFGKFTDLSEFPKVI